MILLPNNPLGYLIMLLLVILSFVVPSVVSFWALSFIAPFWVSFPVSLLFSTIVFIKVVKFK